MPRAYSRKKKRKYTVGSNLTIKESKRITGTKVYGSLQEAIENGSTRFKNSQGSFVITFPKVKGDLRKIQVTSAQSAGLKQIKGTNSRPTRRRASHLAGTKPKSLEGKKVERIAAKGQQFHHMMDLDSYKDFFAGLQEGQKQTLIKALNSKGFFPGDDRRNYIGLGGNMLMIRGGKVTVTGSEHQGDIHPRLSRNRKENPLPNPQDLSRMTLTERYNAILPHLERDRASLQEVIRSRRGRGLQKPKSIPRSVGVGKGVSAVENEELLTRSEQLGFRTIEPMSEENMPNVRAMQWLQKRFR